MKHEMNKKTLVTALTAALLVVGCAQQDNIPRGVQGGASEPLAVRVQVAPQSRSVVTGTAFSHNTHIGIVLHDAGATTTYPDGQTMAYWFNKPTVAAGAWVPKEPTGLMVSDPAQVRAYYPAPLPAEALLAADKRSIEIALPTTLDLGTLDPSTHFDSFWLTLKAGASPTEIFGSKQELDYMTGSGTEVSTAVGGTKETTIVMQHALAMVVVYVKRDPRVTDPIDVRAIAIRNAAAGGPLVQGSFGLSDNLFTPNATPASYERTMSGFPIDVARYAMLVYPATMSEGAVEMELTTDNTTYKMPMPTKEWVSGKVYVYNVEISPNEAQIGAVTLADWPEWANKPFDLD